MITQQCKDATIIAGQAIPAFIEEYTASLTPGQMVALDCETTGLDRYKHKLVTVQLGLPNEAYILDVRPFYSLSPDEQRTFCQAFQRLFNASVVWLGHNLKFDWLFLTHHFGIKPGKTYDTMIAEKALNEGRNVKYGMKDAGERYGLTISKEQQTATVGMDKTAAWNEPLREEVVQYMAQDVEIPHKLYYAQQALLQQQQLTRVVALENAALLAVIAMEAKGALIDQRQLQRIESIKRRKQQHLEAKLLPVLEAAYQRAITAKSTPDCSQLTMWQDLPVVCTERFNLASSQQLQAAFAELGVTIPDAKAETLEGIAGRHELIPLLLEWKKVQTSLDTFCSKLPTHIAADGRIHADFHAVASGRYVTSNPNLQAMPKQRSGDTDEEDPRRCIIAAPGHKLLAADLPNIELRILAEVSGDKTMLRLFAEGKDLHAETAKLMFNLPANTDTKKHLVHGKKARDIAKTINFGLAYGMGATGLAGRTGVDVETAKALMKQYFATYKGVDAYLRQSGREAMKRGYAASLSGRRRYFPQGVQDSALYGRYERSAKNHPIQGTNADILKRALALLYEHLPKQVHIVLTIHDEIVLETPEGLLEQATTILKDAMHAACRDFLKRVDVPEIDVLVADYWKKE